MQPHIRLNTSMTRAKYALLPGDPGRVDRIARFLDKAEILGQNREFRAARGWYQGVEIVVLSTGIGGPSTAIAIEELRQVGVNTLIRIGSCGALQDALALGDVIIAHGAVADDGASKTYAPASYPACADPYLTATLIQQAKQMNISAVCGLVRSHDSFYTDREAELDAEWSARIMAVWRAALTIMFSRKSCASKVKNARFLWRFRPFISIVCKESNDGLFQH